MSDAPPIPIPADVIKSVEEGLNDLYFGPGQMPAMETLKQALEAIPPGQVVSPDHKEYLKKLYDVMLCEIVRCVQKERGEEDISPTVVNEIAAELNVLIKKQLGVAEEEEEGVA